MSPGAQTRNDEVADPAARIPTMVSSSDVEFVSRLVSELPPGGNLIEFGPWLGALSVQLADRGALHVVDSFLWTKDHEKRVPGLLEPGQSFRSAYEANLESRGLRAEIHETSFSQFRWDGGTITFALIDGPKRAADLASCLTSILDHVESGARILLKNGLSPRYVEMSAYVGRLVRDGVLDVDLDPVAATSNILVLRSPSGERSSLTPAAEVSSSDSKEQISDIEVLLANVTLADDHPFRLAPLVESISSGDYPGAYERLARMSRQPRLIRRWEKLEKALPGNHDHASDDPLGTFSEIVAVHHGKPASTTPERIHKSVQTGLSAAWRNGFNAPRKAHQFVPEILTRAFEFGYFAWPSKVRDAVAGRSIVDIGCGAGLHGLGYLAVGATSYTGLDPIVKIDADRVKNLSLKRKEAFGWTPAQIMELMPDWRVVSTSIENFESDSEFEIATLHNVTEHLPSLSKAFENAARLLVPNGRILYNHHNFYCWNGHHCAPKTVDLIDPDDPAQSALYDWRHLDFDPPEDHYISRGLNRIRLDEIIALTEQFFDIEVLEERRSSEANGLNRFTNDVRARHPGLDDRDFLTQNLFCIARRKPNQRSVPII